MVEAEPDEVIEFSLVSWRTLRERRSSSKILALPLSSRLMITRWPSGENRGAKQPGSPTSSFWPVSRSVGTSGARRRKRRVKGEA